MGGILGPQQRPSRPRLQQEAVVLSHFPSGSPCWRDSPSESSLQETVEPEGLDRPSSGPPMRDGMGQGPTGPPQHLYLLKNTCRDWGRAGGAGQKGTGAWEDHGVLTQLAIYWMKSTWGHPSSCSMLSLAAAAAGSGVAWGSLCKGKPTTCLSPSWHQAHYPHLSQAGTHQPGPGVSVYPTLWYSWGNQGAGAGRPGLGPAAGVGAWVRCQGSRQVWPELGLVLVIRVRHHLAEG